jgi:hypothetical protein
LNTKRNVNYIENIPKASQIGVTKKSQKIGEKTFSSSAIVPWKWIQNENWKSIKVPFR